MPKNFYGVVVAKAVTDNGIGSAFAFEMRNIDDTNVSDTIM
jgi:hypothetical protein